MRSSQSDIDRGGLNSLGATYYLKETDNGKIEIEIVISLQLMFSCRHINKYLRIILVHGH